MEEGLYESLMTAALDAELQQAGISFNAAKIAPADQPLVFARHISSLVEQLLRGVKESERATVANQIIRGIQQETAAIVEPPSQLRRVVTEGPGHEVRYAQRPATPLNDAALLTNIPGEPSLGAELRAELASADSVDLLCAFVKWHGLRVIEDDLRALRDRGGKLRVITTTYIGATERLALDRLVRDFNAEVRVNFNETKTRLHAKAWLFRRNTGFHTAYVGSSNLSRTALLEGLEWNVRLSNTATPHLLEKFSGTFDTYWNDPNFELYDPDDVGMRDRLDDALARAGGRGGHAISTLTSGLEVRPYAFQQHMLDALEAERSLHDRHRNLVVAATGTGKTVVAALDYRRLSDPETRRYPRLLFVAHREEILEQSLRTYREVLKDGNFGELYVGGARPERWQHVFASIQSLNAYGLRNIPADAFDIIVIDEFHHAAAKSYKALLEHMQPKEFLGLTATPERTDGFDVRLLFDGRTAAELRIWEALQAEILCPFHYFMISDGTDLRNVAWRRGKYDETELEHLYTGNDARTRIVLKELQDKVLDVHAMRALGFCVNIAHAKYMTQRFSEAGIAAGVFTGETSREERKRVLDELRAGTINIVFSVDVLGEGVDIPDVDTILFLRPTESSTVFLQQLGRGLRQRPDKPVLTALDFVGIQRDEFQFGHKLHALTGRPRGRLMKDVEEGFPYLPSGSQIVLDEVSQKAVLQNLKSQLNVRWAHLAQQLRNMPGATTLPAFLDASGYALPQILRDKEKHWTTLQRAAGRDLPSPGPQESLLGRRARALAHVDDPTRATGYDRILQAPEARHDPVLEDMLLYSLWPDGGEFSSTAEGLKTLLREPALVQEYREVIALAFAQASRPLIPLDFAVPECPLQIHARYTREEILAGLDWTATGKKPTTFREGVTYIPHQNIDALFITLRKTEDRFSPTTMYRDYPISRELFHSESQSTTSIESPTGERYVTGRSTVLLFVREQQKNDLGTAPYFCLGPAQCVKHEGSKPISLTWKLEVPMPADLFASWSVAASA